VKKLSQSSRAKQIKHIMIPEQLIVKTPVGSPKPK
jgi:hypothetical protein